LKYQFINGGPNAKDSMEYDYDRLGQLKTSYSLETNSKKYRSNKIDDSNVHETVLVDPDPGAPKMFLNGHLSI
jgi:hypothetical protein